MSSAAVAISVDCGLVLTQWALARKGPVPQTIIVCAVRDDQIRLPTV